MARYFFNLHDGTDIHDTVGSEHQDIASVREEAVESIAERLRGRLLENRDASTWLMNVTDDTGLTVLIVSLSACVKIIPEAPARS